MTLQNKNIYWHPKYKVEVRDNNDIVLLSEVSPFLLAGPRHQPLISLVEDPQPLAKLVADIKDPMQQFYDDANHQVTASARDID